MEKKFTPGPWKAVERERPIGLAKYEIQYSGDGECVCDIVYTDGDAALIAAAPELFEALEELYNAIDSSVDLTPQVLLKARAALAKATTI